MIDWATIFLRMDSIQTLVKQPFEAAPARVVLRDKTAILYVWISACFPLPRLLVRKNDVCVKFPRLEKGEHRQIDLDRLPRHQQTP